MLKDILINFGSILCDILNLAIFIQILVSFTVGMHSRAYYLLDSITGPVLKPIRKVVPQMGMLDFSPMVAMLLLEFVKGIWTSLIMNIL